MLRDSIDLYKLDYNMTNGEEPHVVNWLGKLQFKSLLSLYFVR